MAGTTVPVLQRRWKMAREKMTLGQLSDIVGILLKMIFTKEVEWDSVSREAAQGIIKGDPKSFAKEFIKLLANGGRCLLEHIIDLDADPFVPKGWKVEEHKKGGKVKWTSNLVHLYLSDSQKDGKHIKGDELRKELENKHVLNANVLDYLLAHPELIPEGWKDKMIYFWGTVYRHPDGCLCIRCLFWDYAGLRWTCDKYLDRNFWDNDPAALLASI